MAMKTPPSRPPVADADEDPNVEGCHASPPCFLHEVEAGRIGASLHQAPPLQGSDDTVGHPAAPRSVKGK